MLWCIAIGISSPTYFASRGENMTTETSVYEYAKEGLRISPDSIALWYEDTSISFRELFEKIDNVADHLQMLGVSEGTVVTIHLHNCPEAVIAIYAVAKLGGICNMVHSLTPAASVEKNMSFTESEILITHSLDCKANITVSVGGFGFVGDSSSVDNRNSGVNSAISFTELEFACRVKAVHIPAQSRLARKCAFYLHSGGSTGKPKTIMLSHSAINNCVENTADFFEKGDMAEQVSLGVLPLFHGFGLAADVHRNVRFGSQLVMMPRWNPAQAVKLIKEHGVTLIVGVPAMFHSLLNEASFCGEGIRQLSYCYTGGDNVSPELITKMAQRTGREHCMLPGFGLTEATTMNCVNTISHYRPLSAGYPVRNTTIAVRDKEGLLHECGIGELVISSPSLMMGYYKDQEATKNTLFEHDEKIWTRTGDEVEIDSDGYLFFKERIKNIIIHNGYNIYPGQLEEVIRGVSGVDNVCVVGIKDDVTHTQDIRAVVVSSKGNIEQAIREQCLKYLPKYAIPKEIVFVEQLPITAMGKIDRRALM